MRHFVIETGGWVLLSLLMSLWLPATGRAVSPIWAPPPLTQLIEEGITQNKEIKSLEDAVESLKEEIPFAGSLDDPRLGFAILNLPADSFRFDRDAHDPEADFYRPEIPLVRQIGPQDPAGR